jgi:hypothetical protein
MVVYRIDPWRAAWARTLVSALPRTPAPMTVLELGAADAHAAGAVCHLLADRVAEYHVTRSDLVRGPCGGRSPMGPRALRSRTAEPGEPEQLPFEDRSVDVVCGFGVLGRCADTTSAAAEIARVARQRVVLLERNALNVRRGLMLLTAAPGRDRPFAPWQLRTLFPQDEFTWLGLRPVPIGGAVDGWLGRTRGLRWQCAGVLLLGQRRRAFHAAA